MTCVLVNLTSIIIGRDEFIAEENRFKTMCKSKALSATVTAFCHTHQTDKYKCPTNVIYVNCIIVF